MPSSLNKSELTRTILNVLEVRKQTYRNLCEFHIRKLSPNARVPQTKKLSKSFWKGWDVKYQKYITKKRQGIVSIDCALNCTKEMACNYLSNIFIDASQLETDVWQGDIDKTGVYNYDETPQFVNHGVDGTPNGLTYVGRRESCERMIRETKT